MWGYIIIREYNKYIVVCIELSHFIKVNIYKIVIKIVRVK
jgi:hypothetical protein